MRPDGVFCAFSPCIEQVQRTAGALSLAGFYNVQTMECLLRMYEVRPQSLVTGLAVLSQAGGLILPVYMVSVCHTDNNGDHSLSH